MYVDLLYSTLIELSENRGLPVNILRVFAFNMRKYRTLKGLSQEALAELAGLHRTYISAIEREKRSISLDNVQKLLMR